VRSATSRLTTTVGPVPEPPPRRRRRNAEISRDGQVPGAVDKLAQPVVVAFLRTGRGHRTDHRPSDHRRSTAPGANGRTAAVRRSGQVKTTTRAKNAECSWRQLGYVSQNRKRPARDSESHYHGPWQASRAD